MYVLCRYVKVYIFLGTKYGRTCQGRYSDYGDISEAPIHLKKLVSDSARSQKGQHRFWRKVKFMFSEKATKIDKIFTVNLTLCSNRQIDCEDFVNFCGLLRKQEL